MILSRRLARRMIGQAQAYEVGLMTEGDGAIYVILTNVARGRTDHYLATEDDVERLREKENG